MKRFIISVIAAIFITVVIPLAAVEFIPPQDNAGSGEPQHDAGEAAA